MGGVIARVEICNTHSQPIPGLWLLLVYVSFLIEIIQKDLIANAFFRIFLSGKTLHIRGLM